MAQHTPMSHPAAHLAIQHPQLRSSVRRLRRRRAKLLLGDLEALQQIVRAQSALRLPSQAQRP